MKKALLVLTGLILSLSAHAEEKRTFKKIDANTATVTIDTGDAAGGTQAAGYVDAQENKQYIEMMLNDPTSKIGAIKYQMEQDTCQAHSTPDNSWIAGCGEVHITDAVLTSFGRGGWMGAGGGYTFFLGFLDDGTGHFFSSYYSVWIEEGVEAQTDDKGEFTGVLVKTLSLKDVVKLPDSNN